MNGRIYDPTIGRFMSADPFIQAPYELQSHNRYAYVMNNPLLYTDPSGYSWWTKIRGIVITVVAAVVDGYGYGWVCGGSCATAVSYYNTAKTAYNLIKPIRTTAGKRPGKALQGRMQRVIFLKDSLVVRVILAKDKSTAGSITQQPHWQAASAAWLGVESVGRVQPLRWRGCMQPS
jgi:hypothetical protein